MSFTMHFDNLSDWFLDNPVTPSNFANYTDLVASLSNANSPLGFYTLDDSDTTDGALASMKGAPSVKGDVWYVGITPTFFISVDAGLYSTIDDLLSSINFIFNNSTYYSSNHVVLNTTNDTADSGFSTVKGGALQAGDNFKIDSYTPGTTTTTTTAAPTTTTAAPTTTPSPSVIGPIISDFIASPLEGYSPLTVQFISTSTGGPIVYYKWYFGDGNTAEATPNPQHTYITPGIYSVGLEIRGPLNTDTTVKFDFIIVNEFLPPSENTIVESYQNDSSNDWKFYVDSNLHLIFNIGGDIYKTSVPVIDVGVWSLVEFHPGQNKMYVSTVDSGRQEVLCFKITDGVTGAHSEPKLLVAENTSLKIDELRVVKREENLTDYFRSLRGHVFYLN